ncbi:unnamed protein product [Thlaspi arvense]|uniref:C2H2-type domain-containing protein n=1 Tax=Thlaspi arvense TaxID=13288 RepID=A0AAU9RQM4_THLAR|nr:unnamed protein product [Thlaspi arvense]
MSQSLHVCEICGKKFATVKAVYGHQRIHSGLKWNWGRKESRFCSISTSAKQTSMKSETLHPYRRGFKASSSSLSLKECSSFMTGIEKHEMSEAAVSLVMFSERVAVIRSLTPGENAMDLEVKSTMQGKIIHCGEWKQEPSEVFCHSDAVGKSSTCSDVVAQALPFPLRIKLQTKPESNQRLHSQLAHKKKDSKGGRSLSVLADSGTKKEFEDRDTNVKKQCVESKQESSEVFCHSDAVGKSSTCNDSVAQALPFRLRIKLQTKPASNQRLHRSIKGQLAHKKEGSKGGRSLSVLADSGVKKEFEDRDTNVKEEFAESKQEFSEVFCHSGFGKSSTCNDVVAQALPFPLRIKLQTKPGARFTLSVLPDSGAKKAVPQPSFFEVPQGELIELRDTNGKEHYAEAKRGVSDIVAEALPFHLRSKLQKILESNSSYQCKTCGKSFGCFQAVGGHQRLHRPTSGKLARKRRRFEDSLCGYDSSEAKEIVSQLSSFEVSQEELIELGDTTLM